MLKKFKDEDVVTTISPISEKIQIKREIFSGAYHASNIRSPVTWSSGSASGSNYLLIYDNPYTSPEANKLLSVAFGYTTASVRYSTSDVRYKDKLNIYKLFARKLLGNSNSIFRIGQRDVTEAAFLCVPRNQYKDEIVPDGNLVLTIIASGSFASSVAEYPDNHESGDYYHLASNSNVQNAYAGKYTTLYVSGGSFVVNNGLPIKGREEGLAFLDAGILVLDMITLSSSLSLWDQPWSGSVGYESLLSGTSGGANNLDDILFGLRHRIGRISFKNKSKMRATFFRTVAEKEEYNYSTNESFTKEDGRIITTSGSGDRSASTYITTIGLYNELNELVGVGKVNKPIKKDPDTKVVINVRLEY